jgi:hypothetical protein
VLNENILSLTAVRTAQTVKGDEVLKRSGNVAFPEKRTQHHKKEMIYCGQAADI